MLQGLFGPWHLLILAVVVFVVVGPRRMASTLRGTADSVQRLVDPDEQRADAPPSEVERPRRKLFYRLGRRLRRRRG